MKGIIKNILFKLNVEIINEHNLFVYWRIQYIQAREVPLILNKYIFFNLSKFINVSTSPHHNHLCKNVMYSKVKKHIHQLESNEEI